MEMSLAGMLEKRAEEVLFSLAEALRKVTRPVQRRSRLADLSTEATRAVVNFEKWFPIVEQTFMMTHAPLHTVVNISRHGPSPGRWMSAMERFNYYVKTLIMQRTHPEASLFASYVMSITSRSLAKTLGPEPAAMVEGRRQNNHNVPSPWCGASSSC